ESLNVDESTVSKRLKAAKFIHKQDYWVPHVLRDRDVERRLTMRIVASKIKHKQVNLNRTLKEKRPNRSLQKKNYFFYHGIHLLPEKWQNVITDNGKYFA
ncbi:hypothetical protein WN51_00380, partial [Melipona quadrifasciata]